MRWVIGIGVVVVLAVLGYGYFRPESGRPVTGAVVQPATPAGEDASPAAPNVASPAAPDIARQAAADAASQTAATDRAQALTEEARKMAQQAAADAAQRMQAVADQVAKAAQDVANSGADLEVGDTNVGKAVSHAVNDVTATLGGISDQASAQAAVPQLVTIDARLYQLKPKIEQLPDDARKTLASLVTGMLPKIQSALDRIQATPGASDAIKPALDSIITKLDAWSHQPT
jgi:hypothetical protein